LEEVSMFQEFLILESNDDVAVYSVRTFPHGTPVGPDAKRLGVMGASPVQPPATRLSRPDFEGWRGRLEREGYAVTLGPFWRNPPSPEAIDDAVHGRVKTWTLEEIRDELLREAERREQAEAHRVGAVESRHP
jgi:hypothetical protein